MQSESIVELMKDSISAKESDSMVTPENEIIKPSNDSLINKSEQIPLTITISNLESPNAPVMVTFYQKKHKFLSLTDILKTYKLIPDGNSFTTKIDDLKYGEYAIASFQDLNSNGVIDKNLLGIPKEPYGFSNNYKPTIRAPKYGNCKFEYSKTKNTITIKMIK